MQIIRSKLQELIKRRPCALRENVQLAPLTTFRVGGLADILAEPASESELVKLLRALRELEIPYFYLGLGSNILVSDSGVRGVVIRSHRELANISRHGTIISAGPAARLLFLTTFAAQQSLSGLEPLSGIPGTVGGGLYMNAGAYGGEISDTFLDVRVITPDLEIKTLTKQDIAFGYRSAPELRNVIVLTSRYELKRGDQTATYAEMRNVWHLRREKQPVEYPSAGSVFKRPHGDFAGRLIEAAGCKGLRNGGAIVPTTHAGIFVNDRGGTATEIASLIQTVRRRVFDKFNVMLDNEVIPIGFDADPFAI